MRLQSHDVLEQHLKGFFILTRGLVCDLHKLRTTLVWQAEKPCCRRQVRNWQTVQEAGGPEVRAVSGFFGASSTVVVAKVAAARVVCHEISFKWQTWERVSNEKEEKVQR